MSGTKHVIVGHPGKVNAEQLARMQEAYDRDLAAAAAEAAKTAKPAPADKGEKGEGDDTGE